MPVIYDMLHQDHEKVKHALTQILDTTDGAEKTREKLFSQVKHDLELHTKFEEEVFYPNFREAKHDQEAKEEVKDALNEHDEAKSMLSEMEKMDKTSDDFVEKVQKLKSALEHHISDEEDEMFPQARKTMSDEDAQAMGDRYQQFKQQH
ncbi:hemerythrin domain-containing protein [Caenispirillum salinarum]|uniref:hemerythrin domain-containing protein n=1 Tax=Caenispirillum salinarum TaxID=859058 RepID=UPI00384F9C0F